MPVSFSFTDSATTEIYTLSLHDALPISLKLTDLRDCHEVYGSTCRFPKTQLYTVAFERAPYLDRKSTRLNSSHSQISYAVFCLKKKKLLPAAGPWARASCNSPHKPPSQS